VAFECVGNVESTGNVLFEVNTVFGCVYHYFSGGPHDHYIQNYKITKTFRYTVTHQRAYGACGAISGFRREVDENCTVLGDYTTNRGNLLPTFRDR
jgi:hypothetical protein